MDAADKFEIFLKICGILFKVLLITKMFIIFDLIDIELSWWVVFTPIIIPVVIILNELGAFQ
jgi:hypothetical protein